MTKEKRLKKRHNAEKRFRFYGLASIFLALLFVLILVQNIFSIENIFWTKINTNNNAKNIEANP